MRTAVTVVTLAMALGTVTATVLAPAAEAATAPATVTTPTRVLAYNNGPGTLRFSARAAGSRILTRVAISVYPVGSNTKIAYSTVPVHLAQGSYTTVTEVTYRNVGYRLVKKTQRVLHAGGLHTATCTTTEVSSGNPESAHAICTNPYYPTQKFTEYREADPGYLAVGQRYLVQEYFQDEYLRGPTVTTRVKVLSPPIAWHGHRVPLVVADGGWHFLDTTGTGSRYLSSFHTPIDQWRVSFDYDCSNFGQAGVFGLVLYEDGELVDVPVDEFAFADSYSFVLSGTGTYQLEVISVCDWRVQVTS